MTKRWLALAFSLVFTSGCKHGDTYLSVTPKSSDQPLVIRATESPATGDTREPELTATPDGRIILSWVEKLDANGHAVPITYQSKDGKQYVVIAAGGGSFFGAPTSDTVIAFTLP